LATPLIFRAYGIPQIFLFIMRLKFTNGMRSLRTQALPTFNLISKRIERPE